MGTSSRVREKDSPRIREGYFTERPHGKRTRRRGEKIAHPELRPPTQGKGLVINHFLLSEQWSFEITDRYLFGARQGLIERSLHLKIQTQHANHV